MNRVSWQSWFWFIAVLALMAGCRERSSTWSSDAPGASTSPKTTQINFYDFTGEIGAHTLMGFEQRTGIRVRFSDIPDNATLQKLDRTKLPHWANLDPEMLKRFETADPGNQYGVPYVWGTLGLAYDETKVRAVLGHEPEKSMRLFFEPEFAGKIATCSIGWNDAAAFILTDMTLIWLGLDPTRPRIEDLPAVEAALTRARPYIRQIDSMSFDSSLANGDLCMTTGPNDDLLRAADLGNATRKGADLRYFVPREGGMMWVDLLVIPVDAPNADAAHRFIDYLLEPEVIADVSNTAKFANANRAADAFIDPAIRNNPGMDPPAEVLQHLHLVPSENPQFVRERNRMWTRVRSGRQASE